MNLNMKFFKSFRRIFTQKYDFILRNAILHGRGVRQVHGNIAEKCVSVKISYFRLI
jgi:hypothetical protein